MTEIAFYHLTKFGLDHALPKLLEKTLSVGKRALVRVGGDDQAETLTNLLWTYEATSWLPHGTPKDGHGPDQPIWITPEGDHPNGAQFVFLTDGQDEENVSAFERCFVLFDGRSDQAVQRARSQWKAFSASGDHSLTYWQQSDSGGWEKKA